jgi:hypothetical protein
VVPNTINQHGSFTFYVRVRAWGYYRTSEPTTVTEYWDTNMKTLHIGCVLGATISAGPNLILTEDFEGPYSTQGNYI